ncbi:SCO family protein [Rhizobiaceae sp. 2RAB30]
MSWLPATVLVLALIASPVRAHDAPHDQRLPVMGPAPDFTLTSQDGQTVSLNDFRGKVIAVTFIYTSCPDICPMPTANMAHIQNRLGSAFGPKIAFVSITVDPEHDTAQVLKQYAQDMGADLKGWTFLTGDPTVVRHLALSYGIFARAGTAGDVDHTFLTSLVDPDGILRVQYLGVRFDPEEFRGDLLSLVDESE